MAHHRLTIPFATLLLVATALWAYTPGLGGDFLFDDFANLTALGATGPVDDWPTFWRYITSGNADPTGRPLALLSFLLDGNNWPTDPYPFKRSNLILHLFNGLLLGTVLWRLGRIVAPDRLQHIAAAALLGSAMWTLHPLMVSTTLYVVQRQAMLPATILLLALHGWLSGRHLLLNGSQHRATWCMLTSVGAGSALAILSKGNGILLPALIGSIEIGILRSWPAPSPARRLTQLRLILLWIPSLLVAGYLLSRIPGAIEATPKFRPWTLGERLLTQPRIVLDYLGLLIAPRPFTAGLYNDNIAVSTGLLSPWTTLPAMMIVGSMPVAGWLARKRHPLAASAVLFFCVGHALESTVIPLELYYEHRNYVPSLLLFWPAAWWLTQPGKHKGMRMGASILIVATLAGMTHARADLWGNDEEQALVWAALNPASPRAQATAALHEMQQDRPDLAHKRLTALPETLLLQPQIALNRLNAACLNGRVHTEDIAIAERALQQARHGLQLAHGWLNNMLERAHAQTCEGFSLHQVNELLSALKGNKAHRQSEHRTQQLLYLEARIALLDGHAEVALQTFNAALALSPEPQIALKQAAALGNANYPGLGLDHLKYFESLKGDKQPTSPGMQTLHAWVLNHQQYWSRELDHLKRNLTQHLDSLAP